VSTTAIVGIAGAASTVIVGVVGFVFSEVRARNERAAARELARVERVFAARSHAYQQLLALAHLAMMGVDQD
jgi:hypothetical protein